GCPVDTSAKQKHRPKRQFRLKVTASPLECLAKLNAVTMSLSMIALILQIVYDILKAKFLMAI
ncbi:MAG: hypothetical protein NC452_12330, partial [Eubacterium sp.]|nr:hypothetical protein [Eubacterium sp.]